jgi:hypothetical protein
MRIVEWVLVRQRHRLKMPEEMFLILLIKVGQQPVAPGARKSE